MDPRGHDPDRQFGGIILDPQAVLVDDVRRVFAAAGRDDDLLVINSRALTRNGGINLIDCALSPRDLAKAIKVAAQSARAGSSDPYWFEQMANMFDAVLTILEFLEPGRKPTLDWLVETSLGQVTVAGSRTEPALERLLPRRRTPPRPERRPGSQGRSVSDGRSATPSLGRSEEPHLGGAVHRAGLRPVPQGGLPVLLGRVTQRPQRCTTRSSTTGSSSSSAPVPRRSSSPPRCQRW